MSLAPGRPAQPVFQRSSSGDNLANLGFSTVQRPSTANFLTSTNVGRKSYAPVTSTPANPLQLQESTQRRSSVYSARPSAVSGPVGHQSFFATAPLPANKPVDPRRLKTAGVRAQMSSDITEFLSQRNFELDTKHTLTHTSMTSPTMNDVKYIFQFLYNRIDPAYRFLNRGLDQEVHPLLKQLRYPYIQDISKSALSAPGSSNIWPIMLGLFHWMMQLAKMMESYSTGGYDEACIEAGYDVAPDRITFQFLSDAYKEWLSIEDDDDDDEEAKRRIQPHVEAMAAKFDQANEANLEQMKMLEAEAKALQDQIDELSKTAPKLAKLDETTKIFEEDKKKFEAYNQQMEGKVEKYSHKVELLQQEIEKSDQEMKEAEVDRNELQRKVEEQGISVQEIDWMNTERERLQKNIETATTRLDEAKDRTSKKESETGSKLEELETAAGKFNSLGYEVCIIPSTAQNAHGYEYELQLAVNQGPTFSTSQLGASNQHNQETDRLLSDATNGYQPQHLLRKDLKGELKKALQSLRKEISERRTAAMEEDYVKMDMLEKTKEALDDKAAELETLGHRLRAAQEEFDNMKELTNAQNMASDAQIEKMENKLSKMRAGVSESVQLMEQREMNTNLE